MGIKLHLDIETNRGPTSELYIRIDSWKVNMSINEITFTTTSWLDKTYADRFLRKYYTDELNPAIGLVQAKVIYYDSPTDDGKEVEIKNFYTVPMYVEQEVEHPVFEEKEVSREVPYISFDENGDEITLYKTIATLEKVKVGINKETKKVIDYTIIDRLSQFSYDHLIEELSKVFPKDKIEKIK